MPVRKKPATTKKPSGSKKTSTTRNPKAKAKAATNGSGPKKTAIPSLDDDLDQNPPVEDPPLVLTGEPDTPTEGDGWVGQYKPADQAVHDLLQYMFLNYEVHERLKEFKFNIIFRSNKKSEHGKQVHISIKIFSLKDHTRHDYDAEIEIYKPTWFDLPKRREAMFDHVLSRLAVNSKGELKLQAYDIQEFVGVLQRHGDYQGDLEKLDIKQLKLDLT